MGIPLPNEFSYYANLFRIAAYFHISPLEVENMPFDLVLLAGEYINATLAGINAKREINA